MPSILKSGLFEELWPGRAECLRTPRRFAPGAPRAGGRRTAVPRWLVRRQQCPGHAPRLRVCWRWCQRQPGASRDPGTGAIDGSRTAHSQ